MTVKLIPAKLDEVPSLVGSRLRADADHDDKLHPIVWWEMQLARRRDGKRPKWKAPL